MLIVGLAMGLISAPATEANMGAVPPAKAGVGSAMNDATRELGALRSFERILIFRDETAVP